MTVLIEFMPIVVAVAGFAAVCLIFLAVLQYSQFKDRKQATINRIREGAEWKTVDAYAPDQSSQMAIQNPVLRFVASVGERLAGKKAADLSALRPMFLRAGIRHPNSPAIFWGARGLFALLLPVFFMLYLVISPTVISNRIQVAGTVFFALVGFYLPNAYLLLKTAKRKERIRDGFPDALDLLVVCVEAGMGLDAAIHRVSREIALDNETLSEELNLMNLELRGGKTRRAALKNLAVRTDLEDVHSLVTLLIQTDKLGTNVATALRVFSETFRTKRYQLAEKQAAKIPVKLTIPLILFIFPALLVTIMGPAFIRIAQILLPALSR